MNGGEGEWSDEGVMHMDMGEKGQEGRCVSNVGSRVSSLWFEERTGVHVIAYLERPYIMELML
jgi:hypothetical protein